MPNFTGMSEKLIAWTRIRDKLFKAMDEYITEAGLSRGHGEGSYLEVKIMEFIMSIKPNE